MISVSVILPTHAPHPGRLARTLEGLRAQTLLVSAWELLLIDNASPAPLSPETLPVPAPANLRVIPEPVPGLTPARLRGIAEARGEILVFVDDDNVLASTYLADALAAFHASPRLAAAGGPVRPEFGAPPPPWAAEFFPLLALHEHGPAPLLATGGPASPWPAFAPVGAGLCLRRTHALAYAEAVRTDPARSALDRRAGQLTSGGDNDMVFTALRAGGDIAYLPELSLVHLIPAARLDPAYLARLNFAIQRSWLRVLTLHRACSWTPIPRWTVPPRMLRAWLVHRAWTSPAARIRWRGACGHFHGRADLA